METDFAPWQHAAWIVCAYIGPQAAPQLARPVIEWQLHRVILHRGAPRTTRGERAALIDTLIMCGLRREAGRLVDLVH